MNCLRNSYLWGIKIHNKSILGRKNLYFCIKPCFHILKMPEKNYEKIQSLDHFLGPHVYYMVKNKKNLKLQGIFFF